jgi:hypothetical protein
VQPQLVDHPEVEALPHDVGPADHDDVLVAARRAGPLRPILGFAAATRPGWCRA